MNLAYPIIQSLILLAAAWSDVASRLISNRICLAVAIAGLLSRSTEGLNGIALSGLAAAIALGVLLVPYSFRVLGGGDVKLLAALSFGLPPRNVLYLFVFTAMAGGALALLHLAMRLLPPQTVPAARGSSVFRRVYAVERWRVSRAAPLPYGVAIACGGIVTFFGSIGN